MEDMIIKIFPQFLLITFLSAQWSSDFSSPQLLGDGIQPQLAATSDGGVFIAWITDGDYYVYIQRFDHLGIAQFGDTGLLVSNNNNASWIAVYHLNIAIDGEDNAIISTVDQRTGSWEVYAWKISPEGTMLWGADGIAITNSSTSNMSPRLTILDDNSVIVNCSHNDGEILFQRISPDGALLWGEGIIHQDDTKFLISPQSVLSEGNEILFQWLRQSSGWPIYSEIFMQKYSLDGEPVWAEPVLIVGPVSFPMGNWSQQLLSTPGGTSVSAWTELAGNVQNAIAESLTEEGESLWDGGVDLSGNSNNFRMSPILRVTEGTEEIMAVWREANGSQSQRGLSAQLLDSTGSHLWGENGISVVEMNSNYDYLDVSISEFGNGMIVSYLEQSPNMSGNIFSKRLDSLGNSIWENDLAIITNSNTQKSDLATGKGANCVFISWSESGSIFSHCLRDDGSLGAPDIISVGECDSGFVEINGHCFFDNDLAILQNMIDNSYESGIDLDCEDWNDHCGSPNPSMDNLDSWTSQLIDGQGYSFSDGDGMVEPLELGLQEWENGRLKSIMCGAYVDCQLSGPMPENINELTEVGQLRFEYNYLSGFIPESLCDLNLDYEDELSFDLTGNLFCPPYPPCIEEFLGEQDTTDCEQVSVIDRIAPLTYNLHNAYPNPFNPFTTLRYDLPYGGNVNITIYDIMGRQVRTLINKAQNAGYRSVTWDATNDYGRPMSAGMYLYQIHAGEYRETKKMVLLK